MIITSKRHKWVSLFLGLLLLGLMPSCSKYYVTTGPLFFLPTSASVIVGPFANDSDTPLANRQVESILVGLLYAKGFTRAKIFPRKDVCDKLMYCPDSGMRASALIAWGRRHKVNYILTGTANEWRYKVGLDGEPVAGVSLVLINVASGETVWSSVASGIGSSRQGLDVLGQSLLTKALANFKPTV